MNDILSVPVVARLLGMREQAIRELIKRGVWDCGSCYKSGNRLVYIIYRSRLEKTIGRRITQEEIVRAERGK
jgi:ribosomal protein L37AE/L43A